MVFDEKKLHQMFERAKVLDVTIKICEERVLKYRLTVTKAELKNQI